MCSFSFILALTCILLLKEIRHGFIIYIQVSFYFVRHLLIGKNSVYVNKQLLKMLGKKCAQRHALHLHVGPSQLLIKFLKMVKFTLVFNSGDRQFHILGPKCLSESVPYFLDSVTFTISIFLYGLRFVFNSKISFI